MATGAQLCKVYVLRNVAVHANRSDPLKPQDEATLHITRSNYHPTVWVGMAR